MHCNVLELLVDEIPSGRYQMYGSSHYTSVNHIRLFALAVVVPYVRWDLVYSSVSNYPRTSWLERSFELV